MPQDEARGSLTRKRRPSPGWRSRPCGQGCVGATAAAVGSTGWHRGSARPASLRRRERGPGIASPSGPFLCVR